MNCRAKSPNLKTEKTKILKAKNPKIFTLIDNKIKRSTHHHQPQLKSYTKSLIMIILIQQVWIQSFFKSIPSLYPV